MRKADAPDAACSRAGMRLAPPSCRGRAGAAQPGERSHRMLGLPTLHPCLRSPDQADGALLTASLQGLGLGRRLRGWDVPVGHICLASKHPWQLKLCSWYRRGSESWSFDGGLGLGQVGLQPPASSLLPTGGVPGQSPATSSSSSTHTLTCVCGQRCTQPKTSPAGKHNDGCSVAQRREQEKAAAGGGEPGPCASTAGKRSHV